MSKLTTIAFDADDTLWQNEQYFRETEERFIQWLSDFADRETLLARLLDIGRQNVVSHGFGMKTFTFSMMEAALSVSDGKVPAATLGKILEAGKQMLNHRVELLPGAIETLQGLAGRYRLVLITKGDLFHQENKVAQSGLQRLFEAVEIVSEKNHLTYERAFSRHGDGPAHSMMIGNSLKSDVIPALQVGGWGVYVPHELTWAFEHAEVPAHEPRYREIKSLAELPALLEELN